MSDDETPQEPLPRGYELELIDPTDPNVVIPHSLAFTSRLGDGGQGSIYGAYLENLLGTRRHIVVKRLAKEPGKPTQFVRDKEASELLVDSSWDCPYIRKSALGSVTNSEGGVDILFRHERHMSLADFRGKFLRTVRDRKVLCQLAEYAAEMLLVALEYLEIKRVINADISPGNVLVSFDAPPYCEGPAAFEMTDFGLAIKLKDGEYTVKLHESLGTEGFFAPETAGGEYSLKSPVFAVGCVTGWLITGKSPAAQPLTYANQLPRECSHRLRALLQKLLQPSPQQRPHASEALAAFGRSPNPLHAFNSLARPVFVDQVKSTGQRAPALLATTHHSTDQMDIDIEENLEEQILAQGGLARDLELDVKLDPATLTNEPTPELLGIQIKQEPVDSMPQTPDSRRQRRLPASALPSPSPTHHPRLQYPPALAAPPKYGGRFRKNDRIESNDYRPYPEPYSRQSPTKGSAPPEDDDEGPIGSRISTGPRTFNSNWSRQNLWLVRAKAVLKTGNAELMPDKDTVEEKVTQLLTVPALERSIDSYVAAHGTPKSTVLLLARPVLFAIVCLRTSQVLLEQKSKLISAKTLQSDLAAAAIKNVPMDLIDSVANAVSVPFPGAFF